MNEPTCSVEDDSHSPGLLRNGMCNKHYQRWRRHGDPLYVSPVGRPGTPEERFWPKVDRNGPVPAHKPDLGPCWIWTAAKATGYGRFYNGETLVPAHRFAYELLVRPIPEGLDLDHLCHPGDGSCPFETCPHHACCNPAHLDPVEHFVNIGRGNTFAAVNNAVTQCPAGHEYTEENTRVKAGPTGRPQRDCRQCTRDRVATSSN